MAWSPDSTKILTHRLDQRHVRETHLIDAMPADGGAPQLVTQRYAYPGDDHLPTAEYVVLDVATGATVRTESFAMGQLSPILLKWAWWADDTPYFLEQARDRRTLSLKRIDPQTGVVKTVLSESGDTRVEPAQQLGQAPMVRVLPEGILWYSQRDGWGHLYLNDTQVTKGEWAVQEILQVDEESVYFLASGLVAGSPYRRTVCRIGLDGSGFQRLTSDDLDHVVTVPPNNAYFVDSASTPATPPVITVRSWSGDVLVELEHADITALEAAGWTAAEEFTAKAADGVTDVYGLLYKPHGFDPSESYAVLDHPYPGPHQGRVVATFDPGMYGVEAEAMAALGFVVVLVDGHGLPGRSKAFHDGAAYETAGGLADHVAAIKELAATRPWMDVERVGVFGQSGGGFATVRALADFPEFYRAGVAEAGNHDDRIYAQDWVETYDGNFAHSSNVEVADRIEGKLLLIHGGMDDNVHPHHTLRLVERLIAADKDFDLLIVPGGEHIFFGYEHYVNRRKWDFLIRNLQHREPPTQRLTPAPLDLSLLAGLLG